MLILEPTELIRLADAVAERLEASCPSIALAEGRPVRHLGSVDADRMRGDAAYYRAILEKLEQLDSRELSSSEQAFAQALAIDLRHRVQGAKFAELEFFITPYRGGDLHVEANAALAAHPLRTREDCEAYLALLHDYGRLLNEILTHTRRQAGLGIYLAAPALPAARTTLAALREDLPRSVLPSPERLRQLGKSGAESLCTRVTSLVASELLPLIGALIDFLDADYEQNAPAGVGQDHYPDGGSYYRVLIKRHADSELEPEAIHRMGLESIEQLRQAKSELRSRLAPQLDAAEFERFVQENPRWRARTPEDIESCFVTHMKRIELLMPKWFANLPRYPWAVERGDPAVEQGMSFGYYQRPTPGDPVGRYRYNGSEPEKRSLIGAAHLIYHELMPGHHYQLSLQTEAETTHRLQLALLSTATIEGWAVYSSGLAVEMGAMSDDWDLYGHAVMQSFIAARLVVDTGLNALGWTLRRARDFMLAETAESAELIDRELRRYATDIPAQALAYDLGRIGIARIRMGAEKACGSSFDIREFHDVLLRHGGFPLPVLASQVERWQQTRDNR